MGTGRHRSSSSSSPAWAASPGKRHHCQGPAWGFPGAWGPATEHQASPGTTPTVPTAVVLLSPRGGILAVGGADHSFQGTWSWRFTAGPLAKGGDHPTHRPAHGCGLRASGPKASPAPGRWAWPGWGRHQHLPAHIYQLPQRKAPPHPPASLPGSSVRKGSAQGRSSCGSCRKRCLHRVTDRAGAGGQAQQLALGTCLHPLPHGTQFGGGGRTHGCQHGGHFGESGLEGPARGAQVEGR